MWSESPSGMMREIDQYAVSPTVASGVSRRAAALSPERPGEGDSRRGDYTRHLHWGVQTVRYQFWPPGADPPPVCVARVNVLAPRRRSLEEGVLDAVRYQVSCPLHPLEYVKPHTQPK